MSIAASPDQVWQQIKRELPNELKKLFGGGFKNFKTADPEYTTLHFLSVPGGKWFRSWWPKTDLIPKPSWQRLTDTYTLSAEYARYLSSRCWGQVRMDPTEQVTKRAMGMSPPQEFAALRGWWNSAAETGGREPHWLGQPLSWKVRLFSLVAVGMKTSSLNLRV